MQIEIDFEVFKELTARRKHEGHTYNEVIRDLLKLPPSLGRTLSDFIAPVTQSGGVRGFALRGGNLPEGTKLKATYKKTEYQAEIRNGRWIGEDGEERSSPSAAASAISQTNVNGLRFWYAKRPQDTNWTRLDILLAHQA
jgi:hypothetical protein